MPVTRVAVGGLGAIGRVVVRELSAGMPGFVLACAAVRDHAKAEAWLHAERITCPFVGAPYLLENGISLEGLSEPRLVFSGTARDAAAGFPANVNVAAALALAGIGPDRTMAEIWADPLIERNCHTVEVDSDSARFTLSIENIPSDNPRTGRITALSVLAALRKLHSPLRIGT